MRDYKRLFVLSALLWMNLTGCTTTKETPPVVEVTATCIAFTRGPENPEDTKETRRWMAGHNAVYGAWCP